MSAELRTEFVGAADAIKALRKIDPDLRKQFTKDVKQIAQPIVSAAQNAYPAEYLSGMTRKWAPRGRPIMPYSQKKARSGVQARVDTKRGATAVIAVVQRDAAATIIDMAGKRNANPLATALDRFGKPSRVMWRAYERTSLDIQFELRQLIDKINREAMRVMARGNTKDF